MRKYVDIHRLGVKEHRPAVIRLSIDRLLKLLHRILRPVRGHVPAVDLLVPSHDLLEVVGVDMELGKRAASLQAAHHLPYADGFAAALAQTRKATLVTSDKAFERLGPALKILRV